MQPPKIGMNVSKQVLQTARATFRSCWSDDSFLFYLRFDDQSAAPDEAVLLARGFTFTTHQEGDGVEESDIMVVPREFIQAIVDAAWKVGIRPTAMRLSVNERQHFEDIRKIAFALSGVTKP